MSLVLAAAMFLDVPPFSFLCQHTDGGGLLPVPNIASMWDEEMFTFTDSGYL
jgi:hypothetical protein